MKCAECKFWKARDSVSDPFSDGFGDCRRRAPSPGFETALALVSFLGAHGDLSKIGDDEGRLRSFTDSRAVWPSTFEQDGCGEYQPRQARQSFV